MNELLENQTFPGYARPMKRLSKLPFVSFGVSYAIPENVVVFFK